MPSAGWLPSRWALVLGAALAAIALAYAFNEGRAQTCTRYTITVLPGSAQFTSEFLYRTRGATDSRSLNLTTDNVGATATVTSGAPLDFGIYVLDLGYERWDPSTSGQELWFEDWNDDDFDDAGLRVATSSCSPPLPPPPPPEDDNNGGSGQQPRENGDGQQPLGGGDGQQPGDGDGQQPGDDDGQQPGDGDGQQPGDGDDQQPGDGDGQQPPEDGDGQQPPGDGEEQQPPEDGEEQQPPEDGEEQQPTGDGSETGARDAGQQPSGGGDGQEPRDDGKKDGAQQQPVSSATPTATEEPEGYK